MIFFFGVEKIYNIKLLPKLVHKPLTMLQPGKKKTAVIFWKMAKTKQIPLTTQP